MTLGLTPTQGDLFRTSAAYCEGRVAPESIYAVLHRECFVLFPDEMFSDLFTDVGRRSVPPMIVAVVMVLQRIEGCSDREAVDRFSFDVRWKYAAGGLDFDYPGFVHTVLVDMRARLARSARPDRIFEAALAAAKAAGLVGRKRILDSTPLYDAVATMDTVTLLRSAIRGLLRVADADLEVELRGRLVRDDDYVTAGKPVCDFDDPAARKDLVDGLAKDAYALLRVLDGRRLDVSVEQFNASRHVGDDSSDLLPPPTPERVAEFFEFLKTRIATARKYGPAARDYALFRTLYHAGLRADESAMLDRADVHFGRGPFGKLHVRFGKAAHTSGPRPRWVPMLDGLDLVLRWFLNDVRGRFPDSAVLFADESGGALHRGTIRNRLRRLMELEGRPATDWFSPHALRRACATHNYERGVDLVAIQQLLGHWTVGSTMRYVRPSATFIEDAYRRAVTSTVNELSVREEGPV